MGGNSITAAIVNLQNDNNKYQWGNLVPLLPTRIISARTLHMIVIVEHMILLP